MFLNLKGAFKMRSKMKQNEDLEENNGWSERERSDFCEEGKNVMKNCNEV